jgi:hypothetical protein
VKPGADRRCANGESAELERVLFRWIRNTL